jgi:predicted ATPase/transcriptional regulator with XRE-family HTH domain
MTSKNNSGTIFLNDEEVYPLYFGEWIKRRRLELDLTQEQLAKRACCSVHAIRKIEMGERRPSRQLAEVLAGSLGIPSENQSVFIRVARGELNLERLSSLTSGCATGQPVEGLSSPSYNNLPCQSSPLVGREAELVALEKLLADPHCRLLTITGLGGIGKTRLAVELASRQLASFPGGVYYVSLASLNSPEFIVPAIAEAFRFTFSGATRRDEQLCNHLANCSERPLLLVLDNLEHLLSHHSEPGGIDETSLLLTQLLERLPNVKILATSREWCNLREEWIFELHGLPVPKGCQTDTLEDYSSVILFLHHARQVNVDFEVVTGEREHLVRICQLVEGTPLAIELAASWISMLSVKDISEEIASNLDFLTSCMKNIPERHRSLRAVFTHSWKLLSGDERNVLRRLAIFRGGFRRQAAEQVARASLPILMSLLSKSLLLRCEDGRYDLHELIRQCALEKLQDSGYFEETCNQHLAYYFSLAHDAHKGFRSSQSSEWLRLIEQEHNNIRAALEWAFMPTASSERVEEGLNLAAAIDRYWAARGHIHEGIDWLERGLQVDQTDSLGRARALRTAGVLYNHGDDEETVSRLLQESLALSRQLNDEICQANALDTLGDVAWHFGDFSKAKAFYGESLELFRKIGNPLSIGLSLASAGRLHVDYGYYAEAEQLSKEGLSLLESASDLRGKGYCLNALGRVAILQGDERLASSRFQEALLVNYELGYLVDISEILHEIAVVEAISGDLSRATLILAAATALSKRIGIHYPVNDPVDQKAPAGWLQTAPLTEEWAKGEMMSMDQAVAYAMVLEKK